MLKYHCQSSCSSHKTNMHACYAPENCLSLIERLGLLTEKQRKAKDSFSEKRIVLRNSLEANAFSLLSH